MSAVRARVQEIAFDCAEPSALARFRAGPLGGEAVERSPDRAYVDPPGFVRVAPQRVPEGRTARNRLHLDVDAGEVVGVQVDAEEPIAEGADLFHGGRTAVPAARRHRDTSGLDEFCFVGG